MTVFDLSVFSGYNVFMDPAWIALIGTVVGGVGLKVIEHWLGRNKVKTDDATQIRDELRQEITALRGEIKQLEADVDKWREQYYALMEKYLTKQTQLDIALQKIKDEAEAALIRAKIADEILPPPTLDKTTTDVVE